MNRKAQTTALTLFFMMILSGTALYAQSVPEIPASSFFAQGATANAREDELYNDGTQYLDENKYQEALQKFTAVAEMKGRRADAALYWKAYAQNKLGHRSEALATVTELRRLHPQSKWLKDAGALELEVKQAQGRPVSPEAESDCDLKVMALNSLMNSDEERAVTMTENVLRSNSCPKAKDKALFVLSQSDLPRAQQAVANIARGQQFPDLQRKAIEYLGINDTTQNKRALVEIYGAAPNPQVKRAVIHAFLTSDAKAELVNVARNEQDPSLRREAIHTLGAMGAHGELHQMYTASQTAAEKKAVIEALSISDDIPFIAQIAKAQGDVTVRRAAIHGLGISGPRSRPLLVDIYNSDTNPEIRDAAIEGLFINDGDDELIALARKETDPQRKRRIVEKLAVMDSRKAKDYMLEILNK